MKKKKKILTLAIALAISVSSMAVVAGAKTISQTFRNQDVVNVVKYQYGDYSTMCAGTGWTGILSTDSRYDSSYKYVKYQDYRRVDGEYILKCTRYKYGNDDFISSGPQTYVSDKVAIIYHYGYVCLTSEKASGIVDSFSCTIYKAK